jgi:hypothetical protein
VFCYPEGLAAQLSLKGQILDPIHHVLGVKHFAQQFEVQYILTNRRGQLMAINQAGEEHTGSLA